MLGSILNGIQIKNEIPDAVGYRTFGPFEFPIPVELKSTTSEDELNSLADISILYFDGYVPVNCCYAVCRSSL